MEQRDELSQPLSGFREAAGRFRVASGRLAAEILRGGNMSENDATLTVETTHGPERVRVVHDGAEDKPDEHWWPTVVSDGPDGIQWESSP